MVCTLLNNHIVLLYTNHFTDCIKKLHASRQAVHQTDIIMFISCLKKKAKAIEVNESTTLKSSALLQTADKSTFQMVFGKRAELPWLPFSLLQLSSSLFWNPLPLSSFLFLFSSFSFHLLPLCCLPLLWNSIRRVVWTFKRVACQPNTNGPITSSPAEVYSFTLKICLNTVHLYL